MTEKTTWRPHDTHGRLSEAKEQALPDSAFAFPKQRKAPLTGASYVREAMSHFSEVADATDEERDLAFENIRRAAAHYRVDMPETDWRQFAKSREKRSYARENRRF